MRMRKSLPWIGSRVPSYRVTTMVAWSAATLAAVFFDLGFGMSVSLPFYADPSKRSPPRDFRRIDAISLGRLVYPVLRSVNNFNVVHSLFVSVSRYRRRAGSYSGEALR